MYNFIFQIVTCVDVLGVTSIVSKAFPEVDTKLLNCAEHQQLFGINQISFTWIFPLFIIFLCFIIS